MSRTPTSTGLFSVLVSLPLSTADHKRLSRMRHCRIRIGHDNEVCNLLSLNFNRDIQDSKKEKSDA